MRYGDITRGDRVLDTATDKVIGEVTCGPDGHSVGGGMARSRTELVTVVEAPEGSSPDVLQELALRQADVGEAHFETMAGWTQSHLDDPDRGCGEYDTHAEGNVGSFRHW